MAREIVVLITTPTAREARSIGRRLVEEKLAACANIVPQIESIFSWQGRVQNQREAFMVLKTQLACLERLVRRVKSLHSYTIPEVIALPILRGSRDYIRWIRETTR